MAKVAVPRNSSPRTRVTKAKMSCEASDTEVILRKLFNFVGGTGQISNPNRFKAVRMPQQEPRMLRSTDSTRLPMLSELYSRRSRLVCLVTCLMLANHGEVATAEDPSSY